MKRLWIADIHANLPAIEAVLADAGPVDEIVFLGDVVEYGPFPAECVDVLRECGARAIRGNHDQAALDERARSGPAEDTPHAIWARWTLQRLRPDQLDYLASLPSTLTIDTACGPVNAIHHTPSSRYLNPAVSDDVLAEEFREVPGERVYFGHSHVCIDRCVGGRRLVGIRAVGQVRDGDPRAGYALETDGHLEHRRVAYDVERTARALEGIGLPEPFRTRWEQFLRTAYDPQWFPRIPGRV